MISEESGTTRRLSSRDSLTSHGLKTCFILHSKKYIHREKGRKGKGDHAPSSFGLEVAPLHASIRAFICQ